MAAGGPRSRKASRSSVLRVGAGEGIFAPKASKQWIFYTSYCKMYYIEPEQHILIQSLGCKKEGQNMWARWKNQSTLRKVLFGLFFLCAVAGGTFVWSAARDARRTAELNSRLAGQLQQSQSASEALPFDDQTPVYPTDFRKEQSGVLTKYVSLKEQYENFVGWITVPQTKYIDMPVVQAADNDYYLKNGIDGKYNWYGAIFMDCGNDPVELGRNTFVYGHNMGDGKMFAELT
jgi:hypothetical protein